MDKKSVITLEVKKGDNDYILLMPFGARNGECFDALTDMLQHIVDESNKVAQNVKEISEKSKEAADKAEEKKD